MILHPEVESKIKLNVVRSLGETTSRDEDASEPDSTSGKTNAELNEDLLEEGVSLKTEEANSEELEIEDEPDNKSTEQVELHTVLQLIQATIPNKREAKIPCP